MSSDVASPDRRPLFTRWVIGAFISVAISSLFHNHLCNARVADYIGQCVAGNLVTLLTDLQIFALTLAATYLFPIQSIHHGTLIHRSFSFTAPNYGPPATA